MAVLLPRIFLFFFLPISADIQGNYDVNVYTKIFSNRKTERKQMYILGRWMPVVNEYIKNRILYPLTSDTGCANWIGIDSIDFFNVNVCLESF